MGYLVNLQAISVDLNLAADDDTEAGRSRTFGAATDDDPDASTDDDSRSREIGEVAQDPG